MQKYTGWLLAAATVLIFSTNTPIARGAVVEGIAPITLAAGRFVIAAVLFGLLFQFSPIGRQGTNDKPFTQRITTICLVSGAINGLTIIFWYSALQTLDASLTAVLGIALFPAFTLIILAFGGESFTLRKLLRLAIVVMGLYLLIGIEGELNARGIFFVLLAAITYAVHIVSVQWYLQPYNVWQRTGRMMYGSAIAVGLVWLFIGRPTFLAGSYGIFVIVYQAIVLTVIGRTILYAAVDRIGGAQYALLTPIETVLAIIWSILFLDERLSTIQWGGAALIVTSTLLARRK